VQKKELLYLCTRAACQGIAPLETVQFMPGGQTTRPRRDWPQWQFNCLNGFGVSFVLVGNGLKTPESPNEAPGYKSTLSSASSVVVDTEKCFLNHLRPIIIIII